MNMKKFLPFLSIALVTAVMFTACSTQPDADAQAAAAIRQQQQTVSPDTIGLSQFQAWKAQNELADVEEFKQPEQYAAAPVVKKSKPVYKAPVRKTPIAKAPEKSSAPVSTPNAESNDNVSSGNEGVAGSESPGEAKAPAKKKISKAAKGAVIGGVVGAVGGAIINKDNRVVGAVIGGVIGAGGGYGVGRGMDKKDGRYLIN
jgi:hypothetical protein